MKISQHSTILVGRKLGGLSMHQAKLRTLLAVGATAICVALGSSPASAIPAGFTCVGNCGNQVGTDGVVIAPPNGPNSYWISTAGGVPGAGQYPGLIGGNASATNGSSITTGLFSATAGDPLQFYFNYVTSDGEIFTDYAYARLLNASMTEVALLFSARTVPPPGNIVPGFDFPPSAATLAPPSVSINLGSTWSPLGTDSGACYDPNNTGGLSGCGFSGWVLSSYTIPLTGLYYLEFGVSNWRDQAYQSGMAIAGITVAGNPIDVPEPGTLGLVGIGLLGFGLVGRRKATA
jgi:uncharacterized RDD family membrane protein YckC